MSSVDLTPDELATLAPSALDPSRIINTPLRRAHFLAQVLTETWGLTKLHESFRYSDPAHLHAVFPHEVPTVADAASLIAKGEQAIANRVYAGRIGNGSEASGDGWRYRGSGLIALTGRANYRAVGEAIQIPLEAQPELLDAWGSAAQTAARFWKWKCCNAAADADDIVAVTKKINPAMEGLDLRRGWLLKVKAALGI